MKLSSTAKWLIAYIAGMIAGGGGLVLYGCILLLIPHPGEDDGSPGGIFLAFIALGIIGAVGGILLVSVVKFVIWIRWIIWWRIERHRINYLK